MWNARTTVAGAADIRAAARILGRACLGNRQTIDRRRQPAIVERQAELTNALRRLPPEALADGPSLVDALSEGDAAQHRGFLESNVPWISHLAVLRALCGGLIDWFGHRDGEVEVRLERGDPFPLAVLPILGLAAELTPHPKQADVATLLEGTFCRLHTGAEIEVVLDYRRFKDLDGAICTAGRFSLAATVHPFDGDELDGPTDVDPADPAALGPGVGLDGPVGTFFGVGPGTWEPAAVASALGAAKGLGAGIAVLPEVSLPQPDALAVDLAVGPRLVVAGSSHTEADGRGPKTGQMVRVNESVAYLDGKPLLRHRKIRPFQSKRIGTTTYAAERREDIDLSAPELRIACGTHARLAVLICSDLNDLRLEELCTHLGVNVLLVPSLTPTIGTFASPATTIASRNQGIVVIANGTPPPIDGDASDAHDPFMVLVAVPRGERVAAQVADHSAPDVRKAIGVVDLNVPADESTSWFDLGGGPIE